MLHEKRHFCAYQNKTADFFCAQLRHANRVWRGEECFHHVGVGASKSTAPKTSTMEMNTKLYEDVEHNILGMENAGKDDDQVFRSFFGAPILIVVLLSLNDVKTT